MQNKNIFNLFILFLYTFISIGRSKAADDQQHINALFCDETTSENILKKVGEIYEKVIRADAVNEERLNKISEKLENINEKLSRIDKLEAKVNELQASTYILSDVLGASTNKTEELYKTVSELNACGEQLANTLENRFNNITQRLNQVDKLEAKVDGLQKDSKQLFDSLNSLTEKNGNSCQTSTLLEKCDTQAANALKDGLGKINEKLNRIDKVETKVDALQSTSNKVLSNLTLSIDKVESLYTILNVPQFDVRSAGTVDCDLQTEILNTVNQTINLKLNDILAISKAGCQDLSSKIMNLESNLNNVNESMMDNFESLTNLTRESLLGKIFSLPIPNSSQETSGSLNSSLPHSDKPLANKDCENALNDNKPSGIYTLSLSQMDIGNFEAYCLRDDNNGTPWTIIQKRQNQPIDFHQNWQQYKQGFGNPSGDHWLGLDKIHALTNAGRHELWVLIKSASGGTYSIIYDNFLIGNEKEKYELKSLGAITCTADDILKSCLNTIFHTYDTDTYNIVAKGGHGGFWDQRKCFNLNAQTTVSGKLRIKAVLKQSPVTYTHMAIRQKK